MDNRDKSPRGRVGQGVIVGAAEPAKILFVWLVVWRVLCGESHVGPDQGVLVADSFSAPVARDDWESLVPVCQTKVRH